MACEHFLLFCGFFYFAFVVCVNQKNFESPFSSPMWDPSDQQAQQQAPSPSWWSISSLSWYPLRSFKFWPLPMYFFFCAVLSISYVIDDCITHSHKYSLFSSKNFLISLLCSVSKQTGLFLCLCRSLWDATELQFLKLTSISCFYAPASDLFHQKWNDFWAFDFIPLHSLVLMFMPVGDFLGYCRFAVDL